MQIRSTSHLILLSYAKIFRYSTQKISECSDVAAVLHKVVLSKNRKSCLTFDMLTCSSIAICLKHMNKLKILFVVDDNQIHTHIQHILLKGQQRTVFHNKKNFGKLCKLVGIFHSMTKGTKISSPKKITRNLYHLLFVLQLPFSSLYKVCENPYLSIRFSTDLAFAHAPLFVFSHLNITFFGE